MTCLQFKDAPSGMPISSPSWTPTIHMIHWKFMQLSRIWANKKPRTWQEQPHMFTETLGSLTISSWCPRVFQCPPHVYCRFYPAYVCIIYLYVYTYIYIYLCIYIYMHTHTLLCNLTKKLEFPGWWYQTIHRVHYIFGKKSQVGMEHWS